MIDLKFIRENPDKIKQALKNRNASFDVDALLRLDEEFCRKAQEMDDLRCKKNQASE